ncbi:helix-turn-helix domain-containing protein [Paenibacillus filicis]|uniref:Helix-turn-helix domain-containing protein n=1 Tax=Paenibacillus gyeongsangnamensis TaxID=3388067 RepID=A0ABT4QC44_9BACL|nr:helix-turn-helix domain-containing protein [Paenibacillus filicis]MCZ8514255.1 helix-turn-helix domain-containing protein [Paenibacillus filicis]
MKSAMNRLPIFYRYLLSYLALFLLPLLFLGTTGYYQLADIVGGEVERNNRALLNKLQDEVDRKLILMNRIAGQLSGAPELSPYELTNNMFNLYQGKKVLESKVVDDSIREIALHIRGTDYLISSLSIYKVNQFVGGFYRYTDWTAQQFNDDLNNLTTPLLRPAEEVKIDGLPDQRLVTYVVPIPINSLHPYGTVLFVLKEDALLKGLNLELSMPSGNALVFDRKGRVLSAQKQADYLKDPAFYSEIVGDDTSYRVKTIQQTKYAVSFQKSDKSGLTYVTMLPESFLVAPIDRAIWQWVSRMAVIFLAGCALVYLLAVFNYNPVKRLALLVEAIRGHSIRKANEFEAIGRVIHDMADSNRSLGRKLEENRSAIKEHLLGSLLKGEFESIDAFNERGKEVGLFLPFEETAVLILEFPASLAQLKHNLIEETERQLGDDVSGYCKDNLEERGTIFILSVGCSPDVWRCWLDRLHEHLTAAFQARIAMGVGNRYAKLAQVGRSYLEASTAIDYKLIKGNQRPIFFDEQMAHDHADILNPRRVLEDLDIVLQHGNAGRIADTVHQIAMRIKQSGLTLFIARELSYDMIRKFTAFMEKRSPGSANGSFPDVLSLTESTTLDEIADLLTTACATLCDSLGARKPDSSSASIELIMQYISQHYGEYDFSVQKIADHFSLSLSYLSRYFKEQTGRTVMDYMNEIRIDQAKRLLRMNDGSVKDIVQQIGYYDVSSFIRKFKQSVGVTPGEYRKQHR